LPKKNSTRKNLAKDHGWALKRPTPLEGVTKGKPAGPVPSSPPGHPHGKRGLQKWGKGPPGTGKPPPAPSGGPEWKGKNLEKRKYSQKNLSLRKKPNQG